MTFGTPPAEPVELECEECGDTFKTRYLRNKCRDCRLGTTLRITTPNEPGKYTSV